MTQGLFANIASAFRQPSTPFSSQEENMGANASQASGADSDSSQNLASPSKFQQVSAQELAAQRASSRHLQQRILATQILVSQFSTDPRTQETLQSILQETLVLTHAGKFPSFDAALAHLQTNLRPEIAAVFQSFTQSEAGRRTLNFIHQSEGRMSPSSLRILVEAARSLTPPSRYLGRTLMLGVFVNEFIHGNKTHSSLFQAELLSLGRDFLYETQITLSVWGNRFDYVFTHSLADNYNRWSESLFSQSAEERNQQAQAEQAETLMQIVKASSPQIADQAMQGELGQQVGFREIENALGRASIFFASSPGDQISMMSNYAASVASGYLSAVLSRTRFSGYALALAAVGGGLNGAVQGGIGLAHQMGNMTSEQVQRNAVSLAWQFFKGILIGTASGMGEYGVGRILHPLHVSNPLLKMGIGILGFGTGDVGAEVLATNALTWVGVSLGLEQEHILEAGGICGFIANGVDELGGGVTNRFNVVNLMNVGAVGAALPLSTETRVQEESENSNDFAFQTLFTSLKNSVQNISHFVQDILFSQAFLLMGVGGLGMPGRGPWRARVKIENLKAAHETQGAATSPIGSKENPLNIHLQMELPKIWEEKDINYILREIVAQDTELYPDGSALRLSAGKYYKERWYLIGSDNLNLRFLARKVRQARKLESDDTKTLSDAAIIKSWKVDVFDLHESSRADLELEGIFKFQDPNKWSEEEIGTIVRAIIAQDSDLYPDGQAELMSADKKYFLDRWYRLGTEEFNLDSLVRKTRQARKILAGDTRSLPNSNVIRDWKKKFFNIEEVPLVRNYLTLEGEFNFVNPDQWTEAEIEKVIKVIIEQDKEFYPQANAALMTTSHDRFSKRWYRIGNQSFTLLRLVSWVRQARGAKATNGHAYPEAKIIREWKKKIFGIEERVVEREFLELQGEFQFADPNRWSEEEVAHVVRAIVEQDKEFYPQANAALITAGARYFQNRRYRIGKYEFNLKVLSSRVRQCKGFRSDDTKTVSDLSILQEWKKNLFEIEENSIEREVFNLQGEFHFVDPNRWTEEEISNIVSEIVRQDTEFYPDGKAEAMSTGARYFRDRWYCIGTQTLNLDFLAGRLRLFRGYRTSDTKILPVLKILQEWKKNLFGIEENGIEREVFDLQGKFPVTDSDRWTEEEIANIACEIVKQDKKLYPEGEAHPLCTSSKFMDRRYRFGQNEFNLSTLVRRIRERRGYKAKNAEALPTSVVLQEWKKNLFGIEENGIEREVFELQGEFQFVNPNRWTEEEIANVVSEIVRQDKELYPEAMITPLSTGTRYFSKRWYCIGERGFTLQTLTGNIRQLRGYKTSNTQAIPASTIILEWKEKLFGIKSYVRMAVDELQEYITNKNLQEILNLFSTDSLLLREMLKLLKPEVFQHNDVDQFIQAYVGLQVAREKAAKITREEVDTWELRKRYLTAFAEALRSGVKLDLSEESFQHQLDLFIRLSRTSYQENPQQFVSQLQESIARSEHPFMRRLQVETLRYFETDEAFELVNMKSKASSYQKEGARFLTTHNLAILGDEAGMGKSYQAIAAVEKLGLKRVLWVTTASNKENIKREITEHSHVTEKDIRVVISGDPKKRTEQVQALNGERYRITNYETLVALQKNDPVGYAKLTEGLDAIIVDEAQMTDNAETLRQNAIAGISTPRKWLLTATPYQNKPEKFWTLLNYLDDKKYPDFQAFKNLYCESSRGLELLHSELRRYMLRRTKRHTLLNFKDPLEISFEEQLQNDALRLPKFERLDPKVWGHYDLSPEQSDLIAWMIADYRGWAEAFNENLPLGAEPIDLNNINPLEKFETIHKVIYSPELFGITTPNPLYEKLDARVREKIARGEKVILWAWNTEVLDQLQKRYGPQAVRIDGTVTGNARERAILDFQNNPNAKILIANFVSGGVGLTLTAATTAIAVQLPLQYSLMYQMEGRHHRLIGLKNIQHAKYKVGMEYLVPQYPAEFLASLADEKLAKLLKSGTLVEQSFARLMGAEVLYRLVMEGYGDPEKLDAYFKQGLLKNLGLTGSEKIDYTGHLKSRVRQEAEVVQALLPLWNMFSGSEEAQDQVLRLMDSYLHYPEQAKALGKVFEQAGKSYPEDLKIILSLFEFKNKHIREQLLKRLPQLLIGLYAKGESLQSVANGLKMNRLNPANLIALMYVKAGLGSETVIAIARRIAQQKDDPRRRYLEEHYVTAIFGLMGGEDTQALLEKMQPLLNSAKLENAVHVLYRLGLMARCKKVKAISELSLGEGFEVFHKKFEMIFYNVLGEYFAVTPEEVQAQVAGNENWFGSADPLLALMLGWQEYDNKEAVGKFQEAMMHVFEGKQKEWRLNNGAIEFLEEEPEGKAYWEKIAENTRSEISNLVIESADTQTVQQASYANLREEVEQHQKAVEGIWVKDEIQTWRKLSRRKQDQTIAEVRESLRTEVAKLKEANTSEQKMECLLRLKPIKELLSWMQLELAMESNRREDALRELNQKEKRYREAGYDKVADHFLELIQQLEQEILSRRVFKDVTIEDTDDAALFIRMGALHPELLNCFNPNANPVFTQNVVAALGSKNMRLVVVREQGKIIAVAMMKVKQSEDGKPVLFLEKGLYRKGYDFRKEMLSHLLKKASSLPIATKVATQIMGKSNDEDPFLIGTGAFTKSVYEEAVFGLRASNNVRHRGRWVTNLSLQVNERERGHPSNAESAGSSRPGTTQDKQQSLFPLESNGPLVGIGTSNKPIEKYIEELKRGKVTCVVDVRETPRSQWNAQFNRRALEASLVQAGIRYVFMGDTLGNPKDGSGERSLENFEQEHRQTEAYKRGLNLLLELIRKNSGKVALTCSEGKEQECHRKFILRDVQHLLSNETNQN